MPHQENHAHHHVSHKKKTPVVTPIRLAIAILLLIFFSLLFMLKDKGGNKSKKSGLKEQDIVLEQKKIALTPTPIVAPVAKGKQLYYIRTKDKPELMSAEFDPLDALKGKEQKITVTAKNDNPIDEITLTFSRDGKKYPVSMKLTEGTNTSGTWVGSWKAEGTYERDYVAVIEGKSGGQKSKVEVTFR